MKSILGGILVVGIVLIIPVFLFLFMLGWKTAVRVEHESAQLAVIDLIPEADPTVAKTEEPEAPPIKPEASQEKATPPKPKPAKPRPEPIPQPVDPNRPGWVNKPGKLEGDIYRMSVPSGLYVTRLECERALDVAMDDAVIEYVESYLGTDEAKLVSLDDRYVKHLIQTKEYEETVKSTVGPMKQVHALLEFDKHVRAEIMDRYRAAIVRMRLWTFGSGTVAILALIGTLFGYLKLDHLTSGHHRRRLQWAAAATILGVVAGAALIHTQAFTARL